MQIATWLTVVFLCPFSDCSTATENVIEIKTGLLGIDEACSRIRSLQATVTLCAKAHNRFGIYPPIHSFHMRLRLDFCSIAVFL
jgi:hypothetical protein